MAGGTGRELTSSKNSQLVKISKNGFEKAALGTSSAKTANDHSHQKFGIVLLKVDVLPLLKRGNWLTIAFTRIHSAEGVS